MSSHGIFNKTDYILVHKIHPNILKKKKKKEIIQSLPPPFERMFATVLTP